MDASTLREVGQLWALPTQCLGRFLGIIGQDPSIPSPTGYKLTSSIFLYEFEVYSIYSSQMINHVLEVLNFKLN